MNVAQAFIKALPAGAMISAADVPGDPRKMAYNALTYATRTGLVDRLGYGSYERTDVDHPAPARIVWVCDGCGHLSVNRNGMPVAPLFDEMMRRGPPVLACCPERKMIQHQLVRVQ